jgi:hypothetical protein
MLCPRSRSSLTKLASVMSVVAAEMGSGIGVQATQHARVRRNIRAIKGGEKAVKSVKKINLSVP